MIEKIPFCYTEDITAVNQRQFEVHLKLYEGYVNAINEIDEDLMDNAHRDTANATFSYFRELKRGETYALDGVILHELYFENMGGIVKKPGPMTKERIEYDFGSLTKWVEDFIATAQVSRGWAMLAYDQRSCRLRNISLDAHDVGNITYSAPILVLDMYEHAYFLQYANHKNEYINQFMRNINWQVIEERACLL